jgi:hypothetical protein
MALPARNRDHAAVKAGVLGAAALLAACAGGPPPAEWQLNARGALAQYQRSYFAGDSALAQKEFAQARAEIARTGRADLLARAELVRCAVRTASLEFDDCPGFEALRADARAEEIAYADYLAGRAARAATDEPLSRLVAAGVRLKSATITPEGIAGAIDIASSQGWRRPLLAWLTLQAKRAEEAGNQAALARIRRRIELITEAK